MQFDASVLSKDKMDVVFRCGVRGGFDSVCSVKM
jgi:hypothetical protein